MIDSSEFPFPFSLIFKYFWLLAILAPFVYIPLFKMKANPYIKEDPSLEDGYNKLIIGIILSTILPWVVIGIGMIFGKYDTFFDIMFGLRDWTPFSILFFGAIIAEAVLYFIWVWFRGGSEFLIKYHGILNMPRSSAQIKIMAAAMVA